MAIKQEEWKAIDEAIEKVVAPLRPRGWRKALFLLREWGVLGTVGTIIVGLLAITTGAIYQLVARADRDARFQTQTSDALKDIRAEIDGIKATLLKQTLTARAALRPKEFEETLPDLTASLAAARQQNVKVPPKIVADLAEKMDAANTGSPQFWSAAAQLISYRSLNSLSWPVPVESLLPDCADLKINTGTLDQKFRGRTGIPGELKTNLGDYRDCRIALDSAKDGARLKSLLLSEHFARIFFYHCVVVYHGGSITFPIASDNRVVNSARAGPTIVRSTVSGYNLTFMDCLFDFSLSGPPQTQGQQLTKLLLPQNTSTVVIPVIAPSS